MGSKINTFHELMSKLNSTFHFGGKTATETIVKNCRIKEGSSILDLGCGVGQNSLYMAQKYNCWVTGLDNLGEMIKRAKKRAFEHEMNHKVTFVKGDIFKIPFPDNYFDLVIIESVLSFVINKEQALKEILRVCKKGGHIGLNEMVTSNRSTMKAMKESFFKCDLWTPTKWKKEFKKMKLEEIFIQENNIDLFDQIFDETTMNSDYRFIKRFILLYIIGGNYRKVLNILIKNVLSIAYQNLKKMNYIIYILKK